MLRRNYAKSLVFCLAGDTETVAIPTPSPHFLHPRQHIDSLSLFPSPIYALPSGRFWGPFCGIPERALGDWAGVHCRWKVLSRNPAFWARGAKGTFPTQWPLPPETGRDSPWTPSSGVALSPLTCFLPSDHEAQTSETPSKTKSVWRRRLSVVLVRWAERFPHLQVMEAGAYGELPRGEWKALFSITSLWLPTGLAFLDFWGGKQASGMDLTFCTRLKERIWDFRPGLRSWYD